MRTLNLTLPDDLLDRIQRIAKKEARSTSVVVRNAISAGLAIRSRRERHRGIQAYVKRYAESTHDLDPELESAAIECLRTSLGDEQ